MNLFYPLTSNSWNEEEMKAILRVLRQGNFSMGEQVAQFESQFATKFGTKYAVMFNSGSSASLAGVASLVFKKDRPLKKGDEVIIPAVGWSTTYFPFHQYGLHFRIVDVELDTLNIDTTKLEKAITHRTKAVVAFNLMGNPAALETLKAFCRRHNLYLIEDACESLGAELRGRKCGSWGDIAMFSFSIASHISTMEGGMMLTDDKELYHIARSLRSYGSTKGLPSESPIYVKKAEEFPGGWRFVLPGFNLRPLEIAGAAGLEQFKKLESGLEVRRQNACLFQEKFAGDKRFILQKENGKSSWYGFTVILHPDLKVDRNRVLESLTAAGIESGQIAGGNILRHDVVSLFEQEAAGGITVANILHDRGFYVGNYSADLTKQIEMFHQVLTKTVASMTPAAIPVKKPGYPSAA